MLDDGTRHLALLVGRSAAGARRSCQSTRPSPQPATTGRSRHMVPARTRASNARRTAGLWCGAEYHGARLRAEPSAFVMPAKLRMHAERDVAADISARGQVPCTMQSTSSQTIISSGCRSMAAKMYLAFAMVLVSHMRPAFSASTKSCAWPSRSRARHQRHQPAPIIAVKKPNTITLRIGCGPVCRLPMILSSLTRTRVCLLRSIPTDWTLIWRKRFWNLASNLRRLTLFEDCCAKARRTALRPNCHEPRRCLVRLGVTLISPRRLLQRKVHRLCVISVPTTISAAPAKVARPGTSAKNRKPSSTPQTSVT
jgi:hypothetical protein